MMRLNLTIDPGLDGTPPGTHISERRISRAESEWAKGMAQARQGWEGAKGRRGREAPGRADNLEGICF